MSSVTSLLSATATSAAAPTSTGGNRAAPQGGVIEGANPSVYNPKDPITMFIIQVGGLALQTRQFVRKHAWTSD